MEKKTMRLVFSGRDRSGLDPGTRRLLRCMLSPLTGMSRSIGFMIRGAGEPRMMTAGGELTGVHILQKRPDPGLGHYHIGGSGIFFDEPLIKCLGETAERYAQFVSDTSDQFSITVASQTEMVTRGEPLLDERYMRVFLASQYEQPDFPFRSFDPETPMGWLRAPSLTGKEAVWVPAQFVMVGYTGRPGERKLNASVTTGTATHTAHAPALRNALMELVQIDSAMGHWYSKARAPRIKMDARTNALSRLISDYFDVRRHRPAFYLLENPDLPGFSVACLLRRPEGFPSIGVGLGAGLQLQDALYAALTESVGVVQMAKKAIIDELDQVGEAEVDPTRIYDLDSNVTYYAHENKADLVAAKFSDEHVIAASDLPEDTLRDPAIEVKTLVDGFRNSGKALFELDLTTPDVADLGLYTARVWSPDTISLSLPSAPPLAHPRFDAYGGTDNTVLPHPYP